MKRELFHNTATGVMVACALVITVLVVRREFFPPEGVDTTAVRGAGEGEDVREWRAYAAEGHRMGPNGAPVTLVEFSDFQCPACRKLASSLQSIRAKYPEEVLLVYRHFPLSSHAFAVPAARASECAAVQGRFEQFHDALFAKQDSIGILPWSRFARVAEVEDLNAFERCVREVGPVPALHQDTLAGNRIGITGTPTLLLNGRRLIGAPPLAVLERYVQQELDATK